MIGLDILLKSAIGAGITFLIAVLSKSQYMVLAGLVPMFPTFAIMAHVITYEAGGEASLKAVAWFGILSVIPYLAYLISVLLCINYTSLGIALSLSLVAWVVTAGALFYLWTHGLSSLLLN